MAPVSINEQSLRAAMRERRHWQPGQPEQERFGTWVSDGWRALVAVGGNAGATDSVAGR